MSVQSCLCCLVSRQAVKQKNLAEVSPVAHLIARHMALAVPDSHVFIVDLGASRSATSVEHAELTRGARSGFSISLMEMISCAESL